MDVLPMNLDYGGSTFVRTFAVNLRTCMVTKLRNDHVIVLKFCLYEGESNENLKSAIKIRNTARLSCELTTVILVI